MMMKFENTYSFIFHLFFIHQIHLSLSPVLFVHVQFVFTEKLIICQHENQKFVGVFKNKAYIRITVDWNSISYFLDKLPFPGFYICIALCVYVYPCSPSSTPIVHLSSRNLWEFQFVISKINYKIIRTLAKLIPRRIIN